MLCVRGTRHLRSLVAVGEDSKQGNRLSGIAPIAPQIAGSVTRYTLLARCVCDEFAVSRDRPDVATVGFFPAGEKELESRFKIDLVTRQITSPKTPNRYLDLSRLATIVSLGISRELVFP
jgi:hypothetical protein